MNVHRIPIGEASPKGCSRRSSVGGPNCPPGTIFATPYSIIAMASPKRT